MTTSLQNLSALCAKCGQPLTISRISAGYAFCYKCKSCGGYSAVCLRGGNVKVEPIKALSVPVTAGIYFCSAGIFGIATLGSVIAAIANIRSNPVLSAATIFAALPFGPCTWLFLWLGIVTLRGDPSFGFLHRGIRESVAFKKFMQFVRDRGEGIAVTFAAIICWVGLGLIYRCGGMSYLIGCGTLLGPTTLLLTYFAFGGDIPLKLRQKGVRRLTVIPIVFFVSLIAFFVVVHFIPAGPN